MIKLLLLLIAGFAVHIIRDYDRARMNNSSVDYLKKNSLKIAGSFIMSCCLFVVLEVDGDLSGIASLTVGYSGSSFFKYLIDKNWPNARF